MSPADPELPCGPVRIGLVGLRFGICHLQTLLALPEFRVVGVADRHDAPEAMALARHHGIPVFREAGEMVDAASPQALSLCTAPRGRASVLELAAARGLAVYVEKPWAGCSEQGDDLASRCAPIADRVMLGFNFRFLPAFERLAALLAEGILGQPRMLNAEYAFPWNLPADAWLWHPGHGGGVFNENSCHLIDAVSTLIGDPVAVTAEVANPRGLPMPELAAVTLRGSTGAIAAITLGGLGARGMRDHPRLDLLASRGRACLRGRDHAWERLSWCAAEDHEPRSWDAPAEPMTDSRLSPALRRFAAAVRTGGPMPATISHGQRAVRVAEAIAAAASGGRRVAVPYP